MSANARNGKKAGGPIHFRQLTSISNAVNELGMSVGGEVRRCVETFEQEDEEEVVTLCIAVSRDRRFGRNFCQHQSVRP